MALLYLQEDDFGFRETIDRSCRNCVNYKRVQHHEGCYKHALRGFCILGMGEHNYSLYMSASMASDCTAFLFDKLHNLMTTKENKLGEKFSAFLRKEEPPMAREADKVLGTKPRTWVNNFVEIRHVLAEEFRRAHIEELIEINRLFDISWKDYVQLADSITDFARKFIEGKKKK